MATQAFFISLPDNFIGDAVHKKLHDPEHNQSTLSNREALQTARLQKSSYHRDTHSDTPCPHKTHHLTITWKGLG